MKLKYLSLEFLLFFLFLALPPLLTPVSHTVHQPPRFSLASAQSLAIAILITVQLKNELPRKSCPIFQCISTSTITFGALMLIYAFVELGGVTLMNLLKLGAMPSGSRTLSGLRQWLSAIAALAAGAFYEECLYRAFLPDVSLLLLARALQGRTATQEGSSAAREGFFLRHEKALTALVEGSCALLFAFSHRYLGIPAVVNALLCGIVLRRCYTKTGRILCGTAAHCCYNLTLLAFSSIATAASTAG